ncbi:MAG: class I tRNA ligase family protein, partial [Deltaproteobacteria bacterium]|nr:class I tRNA ligase family protein [Deltaproteobacteria bacterium]
DQILIDKSTEVEQKVREAFDYQRGDLNFHLALSAIWELMATCDKYITSSAPWTLKKNNEEDRLKQVLYNLVDVIRLIGMWLIPFMPQTAEKIYQQLNLKLPKTFEEGMCSDSIPNGHSLGESFPLFPRIEVCRGDSVDRP